MCLDDGSTTVADLLLLKFLWPLSFWPLIGLLLPAINSAVRTARIQEVKADIEKLNTALTDFKRDFQRDVPGSITLCEKASAWATDPDGPRSRGILRQLWPQFSFADTDFNADGDTTDIHHLEGAECLVFFLGGRVDFGASGTGTANSGALVGFSKNPISPFGFGGNRRGPYFEFKGNCNISTSTPTKLVFSGRLCDTDGDGFPEYLDTIGGQTLPYLYYENGYRFQANASSWVNSDNWGSTSASQRLARAYYQPGMATTYPAGALASVPHNKSGYQIISAGFDYDYGAGGAFDASNSANNTGMSAADRDNITNFHPGLLGD